MRTEERASERSRFQCKFVQFDAAGVDGGESERAGGVCGGAGLAPESGLGGRTNGGRSC